MELTILERILLLDILPKEANYVTLKIINDLKAELSFSEKELKDFEIKESEGRVVWASKKAELKKIEFGERTKEIICDTLKRLDESGKINNENITLYEKFILTIKNK
jgi:hypothetical protein